MPGFAGHPYVNRGKAVLMLYEKEQPFAQEGSAENGRVRVPKALAAEVVWHIGAGSDINEAMRRQKE